MNMASWSLVALGATVRLMSAILSSDGLDLAISFIILVIPLIGLKIEFALVFLIGLPIREQCTVVGAFLFHGLGLELAISGAQRIGQRERPDRHWRSFLFVSVRYSSGAFVIVHTGTQVDI